MRCDGGSAITCPARASFFVSLADDASDSDTNLAALAGRPLKAFSHDLPEAQCL